jgi:hypothetical protein
MEGISSVDILEASRLYDASGMWKGCSLGAAYSRRRLPQLVTVDVHWLAYD